MATRSGADTSTGLVAAVKVLVTGHAAETRAGVDSGHVQPGARVFIESDRGDDAEGLDAVSGCEFVDDRIRWLE